MNTLLRNILENYVDTLTEREFDVPFLCLLSNCGFYDIHYTHGIFEFGKDFIAKNDDKDETFQYAFQSKAGNIDLNSWRNLQLQINEMRTNYLSHPNYDSSISLKIIVVLTGRLVGGAALSAQQYREYCIKNGEIDFSIWDKDTIIQMLLETDPMLCNKEISTYFIEIMGLLKNLKCSFNTLELYSRHWIKTSENNVNYKSILGILMDSSLICHELILSKRISLACYTSLMALRTIMFLTYNENLDQDWIKKVFYLAKNSFKSLALCLKEDIEAIGEPPQLYEHINSDSIFIDNLVICQQSIEILGLLALLQYEDEKKYEALKTTDLIELLINSNPACCHLLSDKYAISIIPSFIALFLFNRIETCQLFLHETGKWVCDIYEKSEFGLASTECDENDEIEKLLGYAFDFVELDKRRESFATTVIIDLSILSNMEQLYEDIINDILAVGILPCNVIMGNNREQYLKDGRVNYKPNISYPEKYKDLLANIPNHHKERIGMFSESGYDWESIAVNSVLRDRYRIMELKKFIDCRN